MSIFSKQSYGLFSLNTIFAAETALLLRIGAQIYYRVQIITAFRKQLA